MPGIGFIIFVLPVLAGTVAGVVLSCIPSLRFLASYAVLVPLCGSWGAWHGDSAAINWSLHHWTVGYLSAHPSSMTMVEVLGLVVGATLGAAVAVCVAYGISRVPRLLAPLRLR
jgi:hypothetical protein